MPKLRKMLGDIRSPECEALMRLLETQSAHTLAHWSISYAAEAYLPVFRAEFPEDSRFDELIKRCLSYLSGQNMEIRPILNEASRIARELPAASPAAQAAARAIAAACSVIRTPTSSLGFLFYGAAAAAYSALGLSAKPEEYDRAASEELQRALSSLRKAAVPNEPHPAKINWNC